MNDWSNFRWISSVNSPKIIKTVATRCQILRLKCIKFNFGWGSTPDPTGEAHSASPDLLAGFKGPTSKGEGKGGVPSTFSADLRPWLSVTDKVKCRALVSVLLIQSNNVNHYLDSLQSQGHRADTTPYQLASHGLWGPAGLIMPRQFWPHSRSDWPSFWCVMRVHYYVGACKITSLCVQRLRFVPPWLTSRHTDRHIPHDQLIWWSSASWANKDVSRSKLWAVRAQTGQIDIHTDRYNQTYYHSCIRRQQKYVVSDWGMNRRAQHVDSTYDDSESSFKRHLRTFLFNICFYAA